ncbi:MAG: lipocalin family protein, partial [Bacteroidia bacterium]
LFKFRKTMPARAEAVKNFEVEKYLGTWYEIARFDYRYETHISHVTATYSRNADGSIKVDNRGYDFKNGKWKESIGVAKPVDKNSPEGRLKVSFFRPFYASYNVIALDHDYHYAMVAGKNLDYLWLLSREPFMPENIRQKYLQQAEHIGYKTSGLTWVDHDPDAIGM